MNVKTPGLEENQSIARLKQGDLGGMESLVKRYQVQAVYAAYLIVRDTKLAEDIVQTAYLQAYHKIHQFDERRPFGAWFLRIVINAAIKAANQQKRYYPLEAGGEEDTRPLIEWMLDPQPGPDQVLETVETQQVVWKALGQLPPEQRAAIIMRHFLDMNETEMTRQLHRPLSTIRWWLRTARSRLREMLMAFWLVDHSDQEER